MIIIITKNCVQIINDNAETGSAKTQHETYSVYKANSVYNANASEENSQLCLYCVRIF